VTEPQPLKFTDSVPNSMTVEVPDYLVAGNTAGPSNIEFRFQGENAPQEIIRLDSKGFHYRGQLIEDAGEAHRLFVEFMRRANENASGQPTSEDGIKPIPATESLPGPEDCDEEGKCWVFDPGDHVSCPVWMFDTNEELQWLKTQDKEKSVQASQRGRLTWLPHYALPLPSSGTH
jgi:hypothetical protein